MIWEVRLELAPERADMERSSREGCESIVRSVATNFEKMKVYQEESLADDTLVVGG